MTSAAPHFVIIGAMKCATSTLHDQLARLPGVFMTDPKEPNFFSDEAVWARGIGWYRSLFDGAPQGAICGESSTHYTKMPTYPYAVARLHDFAPHAKLIYIMRDPISRLVSHFIHAWSRREMDMPVDKAVHQHPELIEYSRYAMQLKPWTEQYGIGKVLPVFFERLIANPQPEFERVCRFVGYDGVAEWDRGVGARNVSAERMRRHPALDRVLTIGPLQTLRRTLLPVGVRDRINNYWRVRERPTLSAVARAWCVEQLDPDMAELGRLLGMDLSCENFRAAVTAGSVAPEWGGVRS